jgi:hypothetical protein
MNSRCCGVLDTPLEPVIGLAEGEARRRRMTACVLVAIFAFTTPAAAGAWKHEVVPNNGDELTYRDDGKLVFYLGCGRGFALHVKYPGPAGKQGEADIAVSTSKGRMTFNGEFEDPDVSGGTDFRQTYLGYLRRDPRVFGKRWNAIKSRLLNMLDAKGSITIAAGKHSYRLPPIDAADWRSGLEACKN